jgi:hypothetical protein
MTTEHHSIKHSATAVDSPEKLLAAYYDYSASAYDHRHNDREEHEHKLVRQHMRRARFLHDRGKYVRGIEPATTAIRPAESNGVPKGLLTEGSGYELPFEERSIAAVFECAMLYHVREPPRVGEQMIRKAKRAVFLLDSNHFWARKTGDSSAQIDPRTNASHGTPSDSSGQKTKVHGFRG